MKRWGGALLILIVPFLSPHLFDKRLEIFHKHEGFVRLEDTKDLFILSQTGLRIPLSRHLNATAQFNYDRDNTPAPGEGKGDEAYLLTIGCQPGQ